MSQLLIFISSDAGNFMKIQISVLKFGVVEPKRKTIGNIRALIGIR